MKKKIFIGIFLVLSLIVMAGVILSEQVLTLVSRALVYEDSLVKTQAIVVLSGGAGNRIEAAAKLYHEGYGKKLFFSGFKVYPGTYTSELMKKYALMLGVPEANIISSIPDVEVSTRGESMANLVLLKKKGFKKFILVTSAYHTRRAKLMYENTIGDSGFDIEFVVYPAPDPYVPIKGWWKLRSGQKGIFFEYIKSVAYYFNL